MTSLMRLIKIEDTENIKPFNCGNDDLNGFLLEDARFYREKLIANTFIMEDDDETIAFFSLLNDKISQTTIDKNYWRKLRKAFPHRKHLGSYPAVKIGRLGVATSHRGEGIGTDIISAVKQMLINRQSVSATRFLTVDAYDKYIYRTQWDNVSERQELLKRIYEQAQYTRGEELTTEDQMVALSTCSTSGTNARHVLICRIVHSSASEEGSGKVYVETENE